MVLLIAMDRAFRETHHKQWAGNIQRDLLDAGLSFVNFCVAALLYLYDEPDSVWLQSSNEVVGTPHLVSQIVAKLAPALAPEGSFAQTFSDMHLPYQPTQAMTYAAALAKSHGPVPWHVMMALSFQRQHGWDLLCAVRPCLCCK